MPARGGPDRAPLGNNLAAITREPPPRLVVDPPITTPLPTTVGQRRRQRLRAAFLAAIPLALFVLAAAPRLWAPDLVPFGAREAAELAEARRLAASPAWGASLLDGSTASLATQLHAAALSLPEPTITWQLTLGLLDSLMAVLVYFAARSSLGVAASGLAALLLALSPWAWTLGRDPAPPRLVGVLAAAALLMASQLVRERGVIRACALGMLAALLVRVHPGGWVFVLPFAATLRLARLRPGLIAAAFLSFAALGGSALVMAASELRPSEANPLGMLQLFWWAIAGYRAAAEPPLAAWLEEAQSLALASASLVFVLGAALAARAGARGERVLLLPLVWVVVPLLVLAALSRGELVPPLGALLPASAVLMALPATRRAWGPATPSGESARRTGGLARVGLVGAALTLGVGLATLLALIVGGELTLTAEGRQPFAAGAAEARTNAPAATLRFWRSVADAASEAAARVGTRELVILPSAGQAADDAKILGALLADELAIRALPPGTVVLPLARETVYYLPPGATPPAELAWPSARIAAVPRPGTDDHARLVSLRPRPDAHWLAGVPDWREVRFADGSALLGVVQRPDPTDGSRQLELYWRLPPGPGSAVSASFVDVSWGAQGGAALAVARLALPAMELRRADELAVQHAGRLPIRALAQGGEWSIALVTDGGASVARADGPPDEVRLPAASFPPR